MSVHAPTMQGADKKMITMSVHAPTMQGADKKMIMMSVHAPTNIHKKIISPLDSYPRLRCIFATVNNALSL